jgi:hypothetical protein
MGVQGIEPVGPEASIPADPVIDLRQRLWLDVVDPSLGISHDRHEAGFSEYP